jgi:RimJ/RimL family protein N-acetyltransferase
MFRSAQRDPAVLRFRASVRPDNAPSRNLVTSLGFTEVGSQWDDEDGEETLFECAAGRFAGNGSALR